MSIQLECALLWLGGVGVVGLQILSCLVLGLVGKSSHNFKTGLRKKERDGCFQPANALTPSASGEDHRGGGQDTNGLLQLLGLESQHRPVTTVGKDPTRKTRGFLPAVRVPLPWVVFVILEGRQFCLW